MAVETDIEREIILADFGVSVTIGAATITAIFEHDHQPVDAGGGVQFSIQQAMIICRSSDVSAVVEGTTVVIAGQSYKVTDIQPDGQGMTMLVLEDQ